MLLRSLGHRHGFPSLFMTGAIATLGLGTPPPAHAQGPDRPAKVRAERGEQATRDRDAGSLRARVRVQELIARKAAAAYQNAKLSREVAEIAVEEYTQGIFLQDLATVEGELKLAESDLKRAEDRLEWVRRMVKKGFATKAQKDSEERNLQKAKFSLEQAQSRKKVLVAYTIAKTVKELRSEVAKARSDELAKQAAWDLEKKKLATLERELAGAKTRTGDQPLAPRDEPDQPGQPVDIYCLVEGGATTILVIVPDGTTVKTGQVICELDSTVLQDRLLNQRIAKMVAEANSQSAKLTREIAEIAVREYVDGVSRLELAEAEAEVKKAEGELALAEDQLDAARANKADAPLEVTRGRAAQRNAKSALDVVQGRLMVLKRFTRPKRIKELELAVDKARVEEQSKQAILALETQKEARLEKMITLCRIVAPIDGTVVYSKPEARTSAAASVSSPIAEGATVHERQLLFRIVPSAGGKAETR